MVDLGMDCLRLRTEEGSCLKVLGNFSEEVVKTYGVQILLVNEQKLPPPVS